MVSIDCVDVSYWLVEARLSNPTTPTGRLVFHLLAAIDEWQRELIVEGTHEGLAAARARGRVGGRKPKLTPAQVKHARKLYESGEHTVAVIASLLSVSRQTIYRALEPEAVAAIKWGS